jgi:hypothetical protein
VLLYCAVTNGANGRERIRLSSRVALTGDIDGQGVVLPVDDEALRAKAIAVFFSPMETMVVPKSQVQAAEDAIADLRERYPRRNLTILGARHLRDLLFDRRITVIDRESAVRHYGRRFWARRNDSIAVAIVALLLIAVARLSYGPLDRDPVEGQYVGRELVLKNRSGQVVERIALSSNLEAELGHQRLRDHSTQYAIVDVESQNAKRVFWWDATGEFPTYNAFLNGKVAGAAELGWSIPLRFELDYPNKPDVVHQSFVAKSILAGDFNADGQVTVVVLVANHPFFPSMILQLDAVTGEEISRYSHPGHLTVITTVPTEDGRRRPRDCRRSQ